MSLKKHLFETGAIEKGTPEILKEARRKYNSEYTKKYLSAYRKIRVRKEIFFSKEEYRKLQSFASERDVKVTPSFIKLCAFMYIDKKYLIHNPEQLHNLEIAIRRIGNNINQIAFKLNQSDNPLIFDANAVFTQLDALEDSITRALTEPKEITEHLIEALSDNPELIYQVERILYNCKVQNQ